MGSRGDGHKMARELGISVTELRPSLVPIVLYDNTAPLMGLSLKNVKLSVFLGDKCVSSEQGEMLFTHFGVSGPLVLSASAHMQKAAPDKYRMEIDLKPALDEETLDKRLLGDLSKYAARDFVNSLGDLLPSKLIEEVVRRSGIDPRKKSGEVSKAERRALLTVLKHFSLRPGSFRSLDEAVVTAGGVAVGEIDPATMMSKKEGSVERLRRARVAVFGIGGVGGAVVEALARAGVGELFLCDSDCVSESNINRQLIALHSTVGKKKTEVARERVLDIDPDIRVILWDRFFLPEDAAEFDFSHYDYIVDTNNYCMQGIGEYL